jgi:hypothetical protein
MGYWDDARKQPSVKDWLEFWHGCVICNCDHGCNGWIIENAGKAYRLLQASLNGKSEDFLDSVVQQGVSDVTNLIHKEMWDRFSKKD